MLEKYLNEQYVSTTLLKKSIENEKIVQAYLFCSEDINYLVDYAKTFAKEIVCASKKDENIFKNIDNGTYSELKIVEPDGNFIKKEQLIELQNSVINKPVLGNKIVYIIKNCDKLNSSSANSMLKFLEEPADDVVALLLTDNINNVIPTILSRCQVINLNKINVIKNISTSEILNSLINICEFKEDELEIFIRNSIDFIKILENKKINTFIYEKSELFERYNDNSKILMFLNILIYFYMDVLYLKTGNNVRYFYDLNQELNEVSNLNNTQKIIKKIYVLERLKNETNFNINTKLLFDKLILELGDV